MGTVPPSPPLIEVSHLNHYYGPPPGGHLVLEDVDLTIRQNEVVGLLGRSGSGKSTLLRSIAGLIRPREGEVRRVPSPDCPDPSVAMVFQTFALFPWLTVLANVELGLEAQKVPPEERRRRALEAIDLIGLDGFENAYPKELSGGMRQRVGLARALVLGEGHAGGLAPEAVDVRPVAGRAPRRKLPAGADPATPRMMAGREPFVHAPASAWRRAGRSRVNRDSRCKAPTLRPPALALGRKPN